MADHQHHHHSRQKSCHRLLLIIQGKLFFSLSKLLLPGYYGDCPHDGGYNQCLKLVIGVGLDHVPKHAPLVSAILAHFIAKKCPKWGLSSWWWGSCLVSTFRRAELVVQLRVALHRPGRGELDWFSAFGGFKILCTGVGHYEYHGYFITKFWAACVDMSAMCYVQPAPPHICLIL